MKTMKKNGFRKHVCYAIGFVLAVLIGVSFFGGSLRGAIRRHAGKSVAAAQDVDVSASSAHASLIRSETETRTDTEDAASLSRSASNERTDKDEFATEVNVWLSEISQRKDITHPVEAWEAFIAMGQEYDRVKTLEGRFVYQLDDDAPMFEGEFYIRRDDSKESDKSRGHPWRYEIHLRDKLSGWNVLTHTDLSGDEDPSTWREGRASEENEGASSLPEVLRYLPYVPLSPVTLMRVPRRNRDRFLMGVIRNIHRTRPAEEADLKGGPFWIFDRINTQFWLSGDGELRRLQTTRRFSDGGGFDIDKRFEGYKVIEGIRYPTVLITDFTAKGPAGLTSVKESTGKEAAKVRVMVRLSEIRINEQIDDSLFQEPSEE